MMVAFVVAMLDIVDETAYRRYQAAFPAVFCRFNAKLLVADETPLLLEGDRAAPSKMVILQFPSREEAVRFTTDPEYARISRDRHAGAVTLTVLANGLSPTPPEPIAGPALSSFSSKSVRLPEGVRRD